MNDYTASFVVDQSPKEVLDAINNVRGRSGPNVEGYNTAVGLDAPEPAQPDHHRRRPPIRVAMTPQECKLSPAIPARA
jgi:hypothetical protein